VVCLSKILSITSTVQTFPTGYVYIKTRLQQTLAAVTMMNVTVQLTYKWYRKSWL